MDEKKNKKAIEDASRAVYELYYGAGSWKKADNTAHSEARHAVRLVVSSFEKNGLEVVQASAQKPALQSVGTPQPLRPPPPRK